MATFIRYASDDVVISTEQVSTSTWTNNVNNLTVSYTSSTQADFSTPSSSGNFYINVYNEPTSSTSSSVQYAASYGHRMGSGSSDFTNDSGSFGFSATRDIYDQYRNIAYGTDNNNFIFDTITPDDIWVINVQRKNYKQGLKPGSLNLKLSGSGGEKTFTDDYITKTGSATLTNAGRQFNLVEGTSGTMSGSTLTQTVSGSYGLVFPDSGFIILNPAAVSHSLGITRVSGSEGADVTGKFNESLYQAVSRSGHFIVDSDEKISSQFYFSRAKNSEFNYTSNATFIDTTGNLRYTSMVDSPRVYMTTIGLYNDNGDLLAVAKLSQPIAKDFTKEALIRVKLDY